MQEALVAEVANTLGTQIQGAEIRRALEKPSDLTAWEALIRSGNSQVKMTRESLETAIAEARRAVDIDPGYALAHVTLGGALATYNNLFRPDGPDPDVRREALAHVNRGLAIDAADPNTLAVAAVCQIGCGEHSQGEVCARRALALNPNAAMGHMAMLFASVRSGQADEAVVHARAYLELAPGDFRNHLILAFMGLAYFQAGRFAQALEAIERALELMPTFMIALADRAIYLDKLDRRAQARDAVRRLQAIAPGGSLEVQLARIRGSGAVGPEVARSMAESLHAIWQDAIGEPARP